MSTLADVEYPETDGMPIGETDIHRNWMIRLYDILAQRYRGQRVYVGSDLLLYYAEGQPYRFVVPDVFVVLDCDPGPRRTFKTWEEDCAPDVVFEITSRSTKGEDRVFKPQAYGKIGVKELFLYDPTTDYLRPSLQGFRFDDQTPVSIERDGAGRLESRVLGIQLGLNGAALELRDAASGETLRTEAETERAAREVERAAREVERAAREAAEAEVRRLRAELERRDRG